MLYDTVEERLHVSLTSALGGKGIFTRGKQSYSKELGVLILTVKHNYICL